MSYIGRSPQIGGYHKLDAITTDGSASYTMQLNSGNFVPESANHLIVSVNGVIQAPTDSFTVSGSTITFASALSSSDTIDFIMALGNTLDIGTPSDSTVSLSKLTATGTKDATTFLRGDNTFAVPAGGENTPAFLATGGGAVTISDDTWTKIQLSTEDLDTDSAYDNATNYRFAPTEAGKYFVFAGTKVNSNSVGQLRELYLAIYKNGSNHTMLHEENLNNAFDEYRREASGSTIIDMNGTTDYLELYVYVSNTSGSPAYSGSGVRGTRFGAYKLIGA